MILMIYIEIQVLGFSQNPNMVLVIEIEDKSNAFFQTYVMASTIKVKLRVRDFHQSSVGLMIEIEVEPLASSKAVV